MKQLQPFVYGGQDVRTAVIKGELWWVLKDVCAVLELTTPARVAERLDEDEVSQTHLTDSIGRQQETLIINESGLYNVILRSDKPQAKAFKRWVTHEVLPSIRQTGGYNLPKTLPDALRLAADLAEENETLKPKAAMHDLFLSATNAQSMGDVAKALGVGRNNLFKILRGNSLLMSNNLPYQRYIDCGYFEVIERPVVMGDQTVNKGQTFVTPKGIDYIGRMLTGMIPSRLGAYLGDIPKRVYGKEANHEISAHC